MREWRPTSNSKVKQGVWGVPDSLLPTPYSLLPTPYSLLSINEVNQTPAPSSGDRD
ncbi:hypothetical protein [Moorena sp. SIO3H5]|uniref:hypothetical protein n=1 Tax=Moorena sp. SIO3H5 TaxID=2607834 RepID=UPI0013BCEB03|nr:hypothetical protein [Moorena sp. SIO3H5]NEO69671.1 hypothetical protein [Moorena sp. SIO3H5]